MVLERQSFSKVCLLLVQEEMSGKHHCKDQEAGLLGGFVGWTENRGV